MSITIQFREKGTAVVLASSENHLVVRCEFSAPPGAPLEGAIINSQHRVELKVRDCRRCDDYPGQFVIRGRLVNLSRACREALAGPLPGTRTAKPAGEN